MRESLLKKQKELLELQQKKVEIELLQAKARLQQQQVRRNSTVKFIIIINIYVLNFQIQLIQTAQPDLIKASFAITEEPQMEASIQLPNTVPIPMDLDLDLDFDLPTQIEEMVIPQQPVTVSTTSLNVPSREHLPISPLGRTPEKRSSDKRSPEKRGSEKKSRDRDKEREPSRKKSRKDSENEDSSSRSSSKKEKDRSRKGKEQTEIGGMAVMAEVTKSMKVADEDDEVMVVAASKGSGPTMREAAKAMPRIPKLNRGGPTAPPTSASVPPPGGVNRDPRMLKPVQQQHGESNTFSSLVLLSFFSLLPGAGQHYSQLTNDN